MADDDKNVYSGEEEYQFADLEMIPPEEVDEQAGGSATSTSPSSSLDVDGANRNIRRNALIAIGVILLAVFFYKLIWPLFTVKKTPQEINPPPIIAPMPTQPPPQPTVTPTPIPALTPQVDQKLSALEMGQQTVRSEVEAVNNQLNGISSSVSDLTSKITQLNQIISTLTIKVDQQAEEIAKLTVKPRPKPVRRAIRKSPAPGAPYYIQAVIPGRAWLITPNGSTLTVREGSQIPGYGVVKLIDPNQGRVIMSSGQVIRFSQQDS